MFIKRNKNQNNLYFMKLALEQAKRTLGNTKDNPAVGCVITKNNTLISAGYTSLSGRPHAESVAISKCKKNDLKDSSIYITMEPCTHYGKTPPCTNEIIKSKFKRVIYSINDIDKRTSNKAYSLLRSKKLKYQKVF